MEIPSALLQNSPFWGIDRTLNSSIVLLDEWETKIEKLALNTIGET